MVDSTKARNGVLWDMELFRDAVRGEAQPYPECVIGSKAFKQRATANPAVFLKVARPVWIALQIGQPDELPVEDVAKLHHRYTHEYGQ